MQLLGAHMFRLLLLKSLKFVGLFFHHSIDSFSPVEDLSCTAAGDVRQRLGHLKVSSRRGSWRVQAHTLGNTIGRSDITSMKQVELRHSSRYQMFY